MLSNCLWDLIIGLRYTWGPIYGSESLKLSDVCETYRLYTSYTSYTSYASYTSYTSYASYTSYRLYTEKVAVSTGTIFNSWSGTVCLVDNFATNASDSKFVTNVSGAIWWPNLQPMQVALSGGQIWN